MAKVEQVGTIYKLENEDGTSTLLYSSAEAVPIPSPASRATAKPVEPEHEEKKEPAPVKNPFSRKTWNLTQQSILKKTDPKEYERLKAAAQLSQ